MKEYGLYDLKDYEQCVIIGNLKEIAEYLKCSTNSLRSYMSHIKKGERKGLLKRRYELVKITEEGEEIHIKSDKEVFENILKAFGYKDISIKKELAKFKVFDEFNWILKGRMDEIIGDDEEWKQIPNFQYSISNYGRVRNDKNGKLKKTRRHRWILQVDIYKDGKRYTIDIPRMEAKLFIRDLSKEERVSYIDGDMRNVYYKNLKIISK